MDLLIDCHTHAFADKIADKAIRWLIEYYKITVNHGGRFVNLLQAAAEVRLDACVLLVAATKPEQVRPANDWAIALAKQTPAQLRLQYGLAHAPRIVPFGAYHPKNPAWQSELGRLREAGIKGIKLHPEFQGFDLADPCLCDFFAEAERDFVIMIHVGDRLVTERNLSTPRKIAAILDNFPRLRIITAHMGGYRLWDEAYECLAGRDVYFDTSSTFPYLDMGAFRRTVQKHGTERILYGSDYPIGYPRQDLEILDKLDWLTDADKARIRGNNCARLLSL